MKKLRMLLLIAVLMFGSSSFANAVVYNTYDLDYGGNNVARVSATYFTADEIAGTAADLTPGINDNAFLYWVFNMSDSFFIQSFGVGNPDNVSGVMFGPEGWKSRSGTRDFIWDSTNSVYNIGPGKFEHFFQVNSPGIQAALSRVGWVDFKTFHGPTLFASGPVDGPADPPDGNRVPEPATLLLLGSGLIGIGLVRKRFAG